MTKEELDKIGSYLDKYIFIQFTLKSEKHEAVSYFGLHGYITEIEDEFINFKDNYNHDFIVPIIRVDSIALAGTRRTADEYKEMLAKPVKKDQRL